MCKRPGSTQTVVLDHVGVGAVEEVLVCVELAFEQAPPMGLLDFALASFGLALTVSRRRGRAVGY